MPSRPLPPGVAAPPLKQHAVRHHPVHVLPLVLAVTLTLAFLLLILSLVILCRKLYRSRTAPSDLLAKSPNHHHNNCRRFSYSQIRGATGSFSASNLLGHGGFGSVYKAVLPGSSSLAVKVMESATGSLQGEREFQNELFLSASLSASPHVVSLLGFSSDRRGRRLILVYELMENRSLQDALLDRKCEELMDWNKRFEIAADIARGIEFLHHCCDPPIIHGDIKPSNILLDSDFKAKIGDFGLARVKSEENRNVVLLEEEEEEEKKKEVLEDNGSIIEETDSVLTGCDEDSSIVLNVVDRSPESCTARIFDNIASPETVAGASPEVGALSVPEGCLDKISVDSGRELTLTGNNKGASKRDWWWKQETNGGRSESGRVKDYVMEWIGNEIKKARPNKKDWIASPSWAQDKHKHTIRGIAQKIRKKEKKRKPIEWWKEEFCEELTRKMKKKKKNKRGLSTDSWWQRDHENESNRGTKKKKRRKSIDWWLDGFSGELRTGRRNSRDSNCCEITRDGGISSTPSMRGTVCYIAPEYGGGGLLHEKCDVYSFGVLLLVLVAGRRPLQVTASPMAEFERANLISWARQLACNGRLSDLVDPRVHSLDRDQAVLCITIALLCLQRSPAKRPTMKDIVGMLSGGAEPPHLPFEFSPSPPAAFPFKSRRKAR